MPPPKASRTLTPAQIELIRRWIDEGAKWETHWSYLPPRRPELPKVRQPGWIRNPIDNFVLARLEQEGLNPSPEADKATLIRRVTLDLTGLPPTPAEVDAFLADRSSNAFEKVVDRLLGSPRYGERMAMQWLDLARYADTHGYHIDSHRDMWHWRDWVIDAFNRNLPFDQFTIEQLAGDLLPGAGLRTEDRYRFQPQSHDQLRRRSHPGGVSERVRGRSRRDHLHGVDGDDHGVRALPRSQVRPDQATRSSISFTPSSIIFLKRDWTGAPGTPTLSSSFLPTSSGSELAELTSAICRASESAAGNGAGLAAG